MSRRRAALQGHREAAETADMADAPTVLVLDEEGELARIQTLVTRLGVDCVRWSGGSDDTPPQPRELLVTTGAKALTMPAAEGPAPEAGGPVWLCVHNEDFFPLRDRLRERGVHYLVQMTTGDEALRLLLQQILYRGTDRRRASRLPMDCQVDVRLPDGEKSHARLLELSREGCRLECARVPKQGTPISVKIPDSLGGRELEISGQVIRSESQRGGKDVVVMQMGDLDSELLAQIEAIIRGDRIGTRVTPLAAVPEREPDAYIDGTGIPNWDELAMNGDRRRHPRRPFPHPVETIRAQGAAESHSVMGVELSVEGMRVVGLLGVEVGSAVRVALHSNLGAEPIALDAVVLRDDGDSVALRFRSVTPELREQIAALMDEEPSVQDLQARQSERIVMSEITSLESSLGGC
ncbi:MAG TPA: PilZ domain-containing protein [Myxococcota bacterium]